MKEKWFRKIIKLTLEDQIDINFNYFPNLICCFGITQKDAFLSVDVIIRDNNIIGIFDDFSEYIDGKVAGGLLLNEDYYIFITKNNVYGKEYKFTHWDFIDSHRNLSIKNEDGKWYILEEKNNFVLREMDD